MYVSPEVLNPTLCVSGVGVSTSKSFGPALVSPSKVHTSLLSMLVANDMTEEMISELLASGNAAPMMNSILRSGVTSIQCSLSSRTGSTVATCQVIVPCLLPILPVVLAHLDLSYSHRTTCLK